MRRRIGAAVAAVLFGLVAGPAAAAPKTPVVLVHGFLGTGLSMEKMRAKLAARGFPAYAPTLLTNDNIANSYQLELFIEGWVLPTNPCATKVHLVSFSMGGLSTRYLIKSGRAPSIASLTQIAAPNYGYQPATGAGPCQLPDIAGGQMCPTSAFIHDLNAGDDTPGDIPYSSAQSGADTPDNSVLDGGACRAYPLTTTPHAQLPDDDAIIDWVIASVERAEAGPPYGPCAAPGVFQTLPIQ